ncbi:MAG: AraC family transcriptional regulator [Desulfovibrio sp.]|nr:AraC family transcriptional regulator [Desulfovibrio sp.]
MESFSLPCGMILYIQDMRARRRLNVTCTNLRGCIGFGFCLSGNMEVKGFANNKNVRISSGQAAVFSSPDFDLCTETVPQDEKFTRLSVSIPKGDCQSLMERYEDVERYYHILANRGDFIHTDKITLDLYTIIVHIMNCGFTESMRRMYFDAKGMELFTCCMNKFEGKNKYDPQNARINCKDIESAHNAAYILLNDFDNHPTLHELSKAVGMSRSKLLHVFQRVYHMTPFEYARAHRLEQARDMLSRNSANVTEAAFAAGYSSLSHFAKAFARHFHCLPSECLRRG